MRTHHYIKNVASLSYDTDQCIGCGMCLNVCPHQVFDLVNKKAVILSKDNCMECGACQKNCPVSALKVNEGTGCAAAVIHSLVKGGQPDCCCS